MITSQMLHRLLYLALIDLRYRAFQTKDQASHRLTHLMHNVPLKLHLLSTGKMDVNAIVDELKTVAIEVGLDGWLETQLAQMQSEAGGDEQLI